MKDGCEEETSPSLNRETAAEVWNENQTRLESCPSSKATKDALPSRGKKEKGGKD